jgi:hypothetical protein
MFLSSWRLAWLLAVPTLLAVGADRAPAQTVTYYAPVPAVSYYAPAPVVTAYYAPAPAPVTVTTYRYGLLGRRQTTIASYAAPAPVVTYYAPPTPVVSYYAVPSVPVAQPMTVTYYYGPVSICP